jgi:hypothetical protein
MNGFPQRFVVYDTETNSKRVPSKTPTVELTFRLAVAMLHDRLPGQESTQTYRDFLSAEDFHRWILSLPLRPDPIYVFAHNAGFDFRIAEWCNWIADRHYTLLPPVGMKGAYRYKEPLFVTDSPPFLIRLFRPDGQQYMLLDTYQWTLKSLADLGVMVGAKKATMPALSATDAEWFEYCRQDVKVLLCVLRRIWDLIAGMRIPDFRPTPASQAFWLYKLRWEKKRIVRPTNPDSLAIDRQGYYGGRVECFRIGRIEQTCIKVDVNSMYPYVMMQSKMPCELISSSDEVTGPDSIPDEQWSTMTAEVWLDSPTIEWPLRVAEGTLWVTGSVHTVLCGPELLRAAWLGLIERVGRRNVYKLDVLFDSFSKYLWSFRRSAHNRGDLLSSHLCKLMLNSLHGKFGQRIGGWNRGKHEYGTRHFGSGRVCGVGIPRGSEFRVLAGDVWERCKEDEDPRGFVPIAAWTSSYARMLMMDMIAMCGDGNVWYMATDSLLVSEQGYEGLRQAGCLSDDTIGKLRLEGDDPWVEIRKTHHVLTASRKTRPGVRKNAVDVGEGILQQEEWESLNTGIYRDRPTSVGITTVLKRIDGPYLRRNVHDDGSTNPWNVDNWHVSLDETAQTPIQELLSDRIESVRVTETGSSRLVHPSGVNL